MVLPEILCEKLTSSIKEINPHDFHIQSITPVAGGDINRAYRIKTQTGNYFVKINQVDFAFDMFVAEAKGLALLGKATGIKVPQTFSVEETNSGAFLLMEWVDTARDNHDADIQGKLGYMVASLHLQQAEVYGLDHNNYIGRLPQSNLPLTNWTDFFIRQRLQKQLELAQEDLVSSGLRKQFDRLFARLDSLYPKEAPSLLHGDLWGGNYLTATHRQPVLIDPAVYYGYREMDIAMTKLFGGFSERFYTAYQERYPLQREWEQRIELWNLYPLLVHLNLFGSAYLHPIQQNLKKYI